jgi:hypothetical protein
MILLEERKREKEGERSRMQNCAGPDRLAADLHQSV